jgi:hypothetical protein
MAKYMEAVFKPGMKATDRADGYWRIPPQYATRQRVEMVSPGYSYYAPVAPRCASCGY